MVRLSVSGISLSCNRLQRQKEEGKEGFKGEKTREGRMGK
jgi:hypothetical protein